MQKSYCNGIILPWLTWKNVCGAGLAPTGNLELVGCSHRQRYAHYCNYYELEPISKFHIWHHACFNYFGAIWEVSWQWSKTLAKPGRTIRYALYMHLLKKDSYSVHTCPRPWNDWKFVNWNGDENPPGNCCTCWTGRLKLKKDEDWPPDPSLPWITTLFTMPEVMKKM